MSLGDTVQLVTLATLFIALGLTIWQSRQMMKQTALMFTELFDHVSDSLRQAHTDQRATFFLHDPELLSWHLKSRGYTSTTHLEDRERLYALVKLDTHESIHLRHIKGTIDEDLWGAWRQVLKTDLKVPIFADVWANGRKFYEATFVAIVDEIFAENAAEAGSDVTAGNGR